MHELYLARISVPEAFRLVDIVTHSSIPRQRRYSFYGQLDMSCKYSKKYNLENTQNNELSSMPSPGGQSVWKTELFFRLSELNFPGIQ